MQRYDSVPLSAVRVHDGFWSFYQELVSSVALPRQWEALNDRIPGAEPSHCIHNLKIAAGFDTGEFQGPFFQDSDLAKWLEAAAYSLQARPDQALEKLADEAIALVGRAQQPDGYLNSYFTTAGRGRRWTNLCECHELYVAGHFIEAGVAWRQATGKRNLLDIAVRLADHIDATFGPEPGKLRAYDGHEEIELALARLYDETGEERYLRLSLFFLEERGREPYYFTEEWEKRGGISAWTGNPSDDPAKSREYNQTHLPVRQQREAVGHAVRLVYLLTGMADVALKTGDEGMLDACRSLWRSIARTRMYVTGGIGSAAEGEAFTFAYDLPNGTAYAETCASVGLVFFAQKMLEAECRREYADVVERALYNVLPAAISRDGERYFYTNPLEVWPEACEKAPSKRHVKPRRREWLGCACCPPNLARLVGSIGKYIYTAGEGELCVHQFIGGEVSVDTAHGPFVLRQKSDYPWNGDIRFEVSVPQEREHTLALRIPGWCESFSVSVCGAHVDATPGEDGYIRLGRVWRDGDAVLLSLAMPVAIIEADPRVREDAGKIAIQRGPVVYCLEEMDNGANLSAISIPKDTNCQAAWEEDTPGGCCVVTGEGMRDEAPGWGEELYRPRRKTKSPVTVKAVPYFLWGNRGVGEMAVWIRCGT